MPNLPSHAKDLEESLLVGRYGDDFTGAAQVIEVLTVAGLPLMLILGVPTEDQLTRFPGLHDIGVASTARAQSPEWTDGVLPDVFERLNRLDPQLICYKVCSMLDYLPETGSIGRAIEIGTDRLSTRIVPVLITAPQMRRYQCSGQLVAGIGDQAARRDRHEVTPMTEADVALHLARQSDRLNTRLLLLEALAAEDSLASTAEPAENGQITAVTLDSTDTESHAAAGRTVWDARGERRFVVGSQGVEYALVNYWRRSGHLPKTSQPGGIGRLETMISVSGSVSLTTADQNAWSRANGFACLEFDATLVCGGKTGVDNEIGRMFEIARDARSNRQDPLIHTTAGPDDPAVAQFKEAIAVSDLNMAAANRTVGEALGRVLHHVSKQSGAWRAVVSRNDTSRFATRQLGVLALSALALTAPGASIADGPIDGLELTLTGGQMRTPDYFGWVRDGGGVR